MSYKLLGKTARARVSYIRAKNDLADAAYLPWQDYVKIGMDDDLPQLAYREQNKSTMQQAEVAVADFQREYLAYGYRPMTNWLLGNSVTRNNWFETAHINVYVRRESIHTLEGERTLCIDLANVTSKTPGKGYYGHLLHHLELVAKTLGHVLFVENADVGTFNLYLRRGFTQIKVSPMHHQANCFFKEPQ